jgi:hypothetical protein
MQYDMFNVTLSHDVAIANGTFCLTIPGLSENKPSLLMGDIVFIRPVRDLSIQHAGVVVGTKLLTNSVFLNFDNEMKRDWIPEANYHVRITFDHVLITRMHFALISAAIFKDAFFGELRYLVLGFCVFVLLCLFVCKCNQCSFRCKCHATFGKRTAFANIRIISLGAE